MLCLAKKPFHTGATTTRWRIGPTSVTDFLLADSPKRAASEFLKILDNLESNAEYKGMDLDRLRIVSVAVHKGTKLKRFQPRAMGRSSPKFDILVHVEIIAQEASDRE